MYYYADDDRLLMMGVRLNEATENDIHKLGWFRKQDGLWGVRNGVVKITDSQVTVAYFRHLYIVLFILSITIPNRITVVEIFQDTVNFFQLKKKIS